MAMKITVFTLLLIVTLVTSLRSKNVAMTLKAKWANTPLLLEASEYLAEEGNDKFWSYVNTVAELDPDNYLNAHDQANYEMLLKFSSAHLTVIQMNLLRFSLALRAHSARVHMFNEMGHDQASTVRDCDAFVHVSDVKTCDVSEFEQQLNSFTEPTSKTQILKSDHIYPGSSDGRVTVVLYAEMGTESFARWHSVLRPLAETRDIVYILRHYLHNTEGEKVTLSGYGVELAIKSQEYKAKDDTKVEGEGQSDDSEDDEQEDVDGFVFATLKKLYPDLKDQLSEYKQHLLDSTNEVPELKAWQLQDLSYQAAQRVMLAEEDDELAVLKEISQNFPVQTRFLVKTPVKDDMRKEIQKNQKIWETKLGVYPGDSALFINGRQADLDIYDVFTLLDTMKTEARLMEGLYDMGILGEHATSMLKVDLKDGGSDYAVDVRSESVVWINDLQKDRRYQGWPKSVTEILRPTFPGMLRHIRQHFFNVLFIVDPSDLSTSDLLKMAEAFFVHSAPFRVGVLFVTSSADDNDVGVAMTRAFHYLCEKQRPAKALEFITDVYSRLVDDDPITMEEVRDSLAVDHTYATIDDILTNNSTFNNRRLVIEAADGDITVDKIVEVLSQEPRPKLSRADLMGETGSKYDFQIEAANEFFEQTGLHTLPQVLTNGVPLKKEDMEGDNFEEAVVNFIHQQTPVLQKAVYHGRLSDGMDVLDFLMDEPNVMPRLNSRVLDTAQQYLDISKSMPGSVLEQAAVLERMSSADLTGVMASSLSYIAKKEEAAVRSLSNWIVADVDTTEGRTLVYDAIKQLKASSAGRLAIVHNPTNTNYEDSKAHYFATAVQVAMETLPAGQAKMFVTKLVKEDFVRQLESGEKTLEDLAVSGMDMDSYKSALESRSLKFLQGHVIFCRDVLHFRPGQRGVIANGKVIGPLSDGEGFTQDDFSLLEQYTTKTSANKIEKNVKKMKLEPNEASDLIMKVAALLLSSPQEESRKDVPSHGDDHSVVHVFAREPAKPAFDVVAILDPATRAAQKYTPLIMVLQEMANVNIKVFFNCREKLSEAPLKSFYRYVLEPRVGFDVTSQLWSGPQALFTNLPHKPILTLGVDAPESWLVESVRTQYDLDNIHLEDVEGSVNAEFELEYLLLEGHCFDANTGQPPRGLQFTLGTNQNPAVMDTIVMANLGYFQLKANPGAWNLNLRHGRSEDIYDIVGHDYTDSPSDSQDIVVVMDTFKSKIIKVRVNKKRGKEQEDLLSDATAPEPGLWDSIQSTLTGGTKSQADDSEQDDVINVFSLASGHLYERFLRIMILSVLKQTQSKVKFWFLKNYLSPSFKDFIPHMAEEYQFEYELVQYKWPRWLHQQSEKQRIMWGYKILFLDVLFPLNVNKFIFVDADQIVRTDLKELVDFDLEGAPYGYTPFCDSRTEMDGFRFWKSGYWASHLAGRRYHISALYVVDLKKFRKIAAGDRLRGQYQGLSQDPNSLSNLDQDLPNNMIHQVPIKSLPQEWLWCETWCSDYEKKSAKTIDLCNNPLTKEPKLTAAVRIVPEWTSYDDEIKSLWDRIYKSTATVQTPSDSSSTVPHTDKHGGEL